jgi:hypothetical protein
MPHFSRFSDQASHIDCITYSSDRQGHTLEVAITVRI